MTTAQKSDVFDKCITSTYLPTVMWKFPATLLTYRCPYILQALGELELSLMTKHKKKQCWKHLVYRCCHSLNRTPSGAHFLPRSLPRRSSFHCSLKQHILQRVLNFQPLLNVQESPDGDNRTRKHYWMQLTQFDAQRLEKVFVLVARQQHIDNCSQQNVQPF